MYRPLLHFSLELYEKLFVHKEVIFTVRELQGLDSVKSDRVTGTLPLTTHLQS